MSRSTPVFPEMMDGRVKTLHPKGIWRHFGDVAIVNDHMDAIGRRARHGVPFDLSRGQSCIRLLRRHRAPERERSRSASSRIDIGGPSLVRAAAKNHQDVAVATSSGTIRGAFGATRFGGRHDTSSFGDSSPAMPSIIPRLTIGRSPTYMRGDSIAGEFPSSTAPGPSSKDAIAVRREPAPACRGLQPIQRYVARISFRRGNSAGRSCLTTICWTWDSALEIVRGSAGLPAVSVIKHNNPCGAATDTVRWRRLASKALGGGSTERLWFGVWDSIRPWISRLRNNFASRDCLSKRSSRQIFEAGAVGLLTTRPRWRENVRLMQVGILDEAPPTIQRRFISGGMLVQDADRMTSPQESVGNSNGV